MTAFWPFPEEIGEAHDVWFRGEADLRAIAAQPTLPRGRTSAAWRVAKPRQPFYCAIPHSRTPLLR